MKRINLFIMTPMLVLALLAAGSAAAAERVLELSVAQPGAVQLHNLVGSVRIVPGDTEFEVRAVVSADRAELADAVSLRQSEGRNGLEIVVVYPERLSRINYDGPEFRRLDANLEYQGRRVRVTTSGGERIRVDLEIRLPADTRFEMRQGIGGIDAEGIHSDALLDSRYGVVSVRDSAGSLVANTASGRVEVGSFRGDVNANTGSGAVQLENVLGRVHAKTGSGGVSLRGIDGETIAETGSGAIRAGDLSGSLRARTGSGAVRVEGLTAGPELDVATGSGAVAVSGDLGAVRTVRVRTGSGGVNLSSSTPLSLELRLSTGSGGFRVDVPALSNVDSSRRSFRATVGAGEGEARVSTGSGSIRITAP